MQLKQTVKGKYKITKYLYIKKEKRPKNFKSLQIPQMKKKNANNKERENNCGENKARIGKINKKK